MKRSKFSLSKYHSQTLNMGDIVPIGLTEVLPGDTFQHATSAMIRVSPLAAPVMHPVHVKIHHWFVPHRLVWDEWEDFITAGPDGASTPVFPTVTFPAGVNASTLANYLGLPVCDNSLEVSALPFRGYALIFNEWYRDQDLVDPVTIDLTSGPDSTTNTSLLAAGWEKDYFTTCRPWTQKGPEVSLPLTGDAPVVGTGDPIYVASPNLPAGGTMNWSNTLGLTAAGAQGPNGSFMFFPEDDPDTGLKADLSGVTAATVNELRLAMALQRYEEARARYGSRYTEYLRYLGVKSSDARLQRPEYLGGGKQTIQFSEVLQTAPTTSGSADGVGNLLGHGIGAMKSSRYRRFFEEHGYVFSFMVVRPRAIYADGVARTWNRRTKEDFFQKELQHIGQQEVLNKEVYADAAQPNGTFGYQDRYDEYRREESRIAGEFATVLSDWNMARIFDAEPALNDDFVTCVPTTRIYQSTATDQLYCMIQHSIQARRIVAKTGTSFIY